MWQSSFQSTFTSCRNYLFLEIDSIVIVKNCWNFRRSFSARACTCEHFFATRKSNYTWTARDRFWRFFHLWRSIHESPMSGIRRSDMHIQTSDCEQHNKQTLNWIRLIQVGKMQSCFAGLKRYFSLSKLIQSLFKSVFIA